MELRQIGNESLVNRIKKDDRKNMSSTWEEEWLMDKELKREIRLVQTEWPNLMEIIWNWS
jgi:hypothetical protein